MRSHPLWPLLLAPLVLLRCDCSTAGVAQLPGTLSGTLCDIRTGVGSSSVDVAINDQSNGSKHVLSKPGGSFKMENVAPGD